MEQTKTAFSVGGRPAHKWVRASDHLPKLGATEAQTDPMVKVKLFTPWSSWTWFLTECNPEDGEAFGLVQGHEVELGYISLSEMASVKGFGGLKIERDLHWTPKPLSAVKAEIGDR